MSRGMLDVARGNFPGEDKEVTEFKCNKCGLVHKNPTVCINCGSKDRYKI